MTDSWWQALLKCAVSRSVWALSSESLVEQMSLDGIQMVIQYADTSHADFTRLGVTLWAIWSLRRKVLHKEIYQTPYANNAFVNFFIADLQALDNPWAETGSNAPVRPNRLIAPPENMSKINVDAAPSKNAAVGAVAAMCRDIQGNYIGVSTITFVGISDHHTWSPSSPGIGVLDGWSLWAKNFCCLGLQDYHQRYQAEECGSLRCDYSRNHRLF